MNVWSSCRGRAHRGVSPPASRLGQQESSPRSGSSKRQPSCPRSCSRARPGRPSSRASIPSSDGSPRRSAGRSACSPAPAPARPGRSPTASPTGSRRASTSPPRCSRSPSPPERPARCAAGCAASGVEGVQARTFHSAALRQLRYFWPHIHGTELPTLTESKLGMLATAASRQRVRPDKATLRDVASEVEWAKVSNVGPDDYARIALRTGRSVNGVDPETVGRLFGSYEEVKRSQSRMDMEDVLLLDRRDARRRRAGRRPGAPPVQVVRRRRVPGRLAAPVGAPRPVARRPRRALRRRRPGADDLLVRRRRRDLPPRVRRSATPAPPRSTWSATTAPAPRSSRRPTTCSPAPRARGSGWSPNARRPPP